jgi:predicted XRE-type DNA-binding protein
MICETVMDRTIPKIGSLSSADLPGCVIYPVTAFRHSQGVLTTKELLARMRERNIKNAAIARALEVTPSRVTELFNGERALKLDEAVRLVEAFDLESESSQRVAALPAPVAQLIVRHIALQLGKPLEEDSPALQALGEDIRAFCEFVTDPKVRESIDLAMAFFQALRLRRPAPAEAE